MKKLVTEERVEENVLDMKLREALEKEGSITGRERAFPFFTEGNFWNPKKIFVFQKKVLAEFITKKLSEKSWDSWA